ncbi:MAG: NAD-dependent epimerase/dehydratase family protein [Thermoflavifilum sp.]|nr:NAD-dependent epimerase/dehydratase family protein [Thermoflavifilum sp.]
MSILVTGATGLLGSHLIRHLVAQGLSVKAIYRAQIPDFPEEIQDKVEWVKADLLDLAAMREALQDVHQVYHCAGKVSFSRKARRELMQVNVDGTRQLVDLCLDMQVKRLVHVSSVAALGRGEGEQHITEQSLPEDRKFHSAYALSKYLGEMEVWRGMAEGLQVVVVYPTIILGPGHWHTGSPALFQKIYAGFPFYSTGVNGFVDVRDVAKAMHLLMCANINGERFILNGDNWSYRQLFTTIAQYFHQPPPRFPANQWMGECVAWYQRIKAWLHRDYEPVVTHETVHTSQLRLYYDASKFLQYFPDFQFTPLNETIAYTCQQFLLSLQPSRREAIVTDV